MLGLFYRLLIGRFSSHYHRWERFYNFPLMDGNNQIGTEYHLSCTECGKIKQQQIMTD